VTEQQARAELQVTVREGLKCEAVQHSGERCDMVGVRWLVGRLLCLVRLLTVAIVVGPCAVQAVP